MSAKQQLMQGHTKLETVPAIVRVQVSAGEQVPLVRVEDALGSRLMVAEVITTKEVFNENRG